MMNRNATQDTQAVLAASLREIRRLREELRKRPAPAVEPVAIVGMGCRFPGGSNTPQRFWEFLARGGDGITEVPPSRWDAGRYEGEGPYAPGRIASRRGGFLSSVDTFDAQFFGVSPREAALLDPQGRLLLEVSWEALEHAGINPDGLKGSAAGVFFGISNHDYSEQQFTLGPEELEAYSLGSRAATFTAGRLSYWLGLQGPSLSLDTACSSSLVAVHLACQSLRAGESELALAGGCNVLLNPEWSVVLSQARALSPDGVCRAFDAGANGYVRSEGCGVTVLKLLRDAQQAGDRVLGVIHGSAVNNDGRSSGVTVPSARAQRAVVARALRDAGAEPADVSYVEAHGTGTALGDPIEMRALHAVLGAGRTSPLLVGSVKTNIGHLEAAAGVAGLIKTVLSLTHEEIPPHLHLENLNPAIALDEGEVEIPTSTVPWPRSADRPRLAGVSSFGASGTNAHLIVGEAPPPAVPEPSGPGRGSHLLVLSARTPSALAELVGRHRDMAGPRSPLADICYTAATGRAHMPYRMALTAGTPREMQDLLAGAAAGSGDDARPAAVATGHVPTGSAPEVVFLFTGQGAERPGMGRDLYATEQAFRRAVDTCDGILRPLLGRPLLSLLDPRPEDEELIHRTRYTQPVLLAFEWALAGMWRSWGVEPAAVLGHSVGELTAACVAGAIGIEDALALAETRGRLMQGLEDGAMASVFASLAEIETLLPAEPARVSVAAVNGPESVVVAGAREDVDALVADLARAGVRTVRMGSSRAFHSPLVEPMLDAFEEAASAVSFGELRIPLVSNVTGEVLGSDACTASYLREHARRPVQFMAGVRTLLDRGHRVFLEIGPSPTLAGMARRFASDACEGTPPVFLPSMRPAHDEGEVLAQSLGELYTRGVPVDWRSYYADSTRNKADLPAYPFQRERHWIRAAPSARDARGGARTDDRRDDTGRTYGAPAPAVAPLPPGGTRPAAPAEEAAVRAATGTAPGAAVPAPGRTAKPSGRAEPSARVQRTGHAKPLAQHDPAAHATPGSALLGRLVPSPLPTAQFAALLDSDVHPCLGECVIDGLPVVNVGVYLEAALTAGERLYGPGAAVVTDCLVRQSLVLEPGRGVDVQLVVDSTAERRGTFRYFAHHTEDGGPGDWLLHAQGEVLVTAASDSPRADLHGLRRGLGEPVTADAFYRELWRRRVYLGDAARWVRNLYPGAGEALARLRAPRDGELAAYRLHPGITDSMFQTLFACLPPDTPADVAYLLVAIERFTFSGTAFESPLWVHARVRPAAAGATALTAEVKLFDGAGRTVAAAEGVSLKQARRESVLHSRPPAEERTTPRPRPPLAPGGDRDRAPAPGAPGTPVSAPTAVGGREEIRAALVNAAAEVLGMAESGVDVTEPLPHLGIDSLMAIQLREALARWGLSVPLASVLNGGSLTSLADEVADAAGLPPGAPAAGAGDAVAPVPRAVTPAPPPSAHPAEPATPPAYEPFPLTDIQEAYRIGRTDAFELGGVSTCFFTEVDVTDLDLPRLERALRRLIARHDMLRAVLLPDGGQRVLPEVPGYEIAVTDLRHMSGADREQRLRDRHGELRDQDLDATRWPLFDVRATLVDERRTRLHIRFDGLIADARSAALLFRDWTLFHQGRDGALPALSYTFREYVLATHASRDTPGYRRAAEYWRGRLDTLPPAPELPLLPSAGPLAQPRFTHRTTRLTRQEWTAFKKHAADTGVTPSAALCTAYAQVLAEWSSTDHFTLTLLFFNRASHHPHVRDIVGNCSSTVLLETDNRAGDTFAVRARRVQLQLASDLEHSQVGGVEVLRWLNGARGAVGRATMPFVFASAIGGSGQDGPDALFDYGAHLARLGTDGQEVHASVRTPQVVLDHQAVEEADGLRLNWDVLEALFPDGVVEAMFTAYRDVLTELCHDADAWQRPPAAHVPAADLAVRDDANATSGPAPTGLLHDAFAARAAKEPDRIAVIAPDRTLTYGELDRRADAVAAELAARGAGPGRLVGVFVDKGWEQAAAVLGVLKSGAAYVPLDTEAPAARIRTILEQAGIQWVLTRAGTTPDPAWAAGTDCLQVGEGTPAGAAHAPAATSRPSPDDLAYVIFTSGSTGTPKGVMVEHGAAANTVHDINERFAVSPGDRVLALSSLHFDLSVYDLFGILGAGGAVVMPEPGARREPGRWLELVEKHRVTVWNSVPALMDLFAEHLSSERRVSPTVRLVMLSGDWIPLTLPDRIRAVLPDAELWSLGGATEAAIWSILYRVDEVDPRWASVPYGQPLRNQRFHVLDSALRPRPVWVPGALHIAGHGLARGYLGDDERTRAAFVHHPATGERLYRTGDVGRYLPDGTIELLGREDQQVKIGGHRVELGEVEAALVRLPGVSRAVAAVTAGPGGSRRLGAHAVLDDGSGPRPDPSELIRRLREVLPPYMVPRYLTFIDRVPLTANGKVDRAALPAADGAGAQGRPAAAGNETERELVAIWSSFFAPQPVGTTTDFFELGGDSLLAVRLMARIRSRFGVSLPVSSLFDTPTVAGLAEALGTAGAPKARQALVPVRTTGSRRPLFFVHPVGGDVLCYSKLVELLGPDQPVYALQTPAEDVPGGTVEELAEHYARAVRQAAGDGPYRLGGWSMGGLVALETARILSQGGGRVDVVALIDPPAPGAVAEPDDVALLAWLARDLAGITGGDWAPGGEEFRAADGTASTEVFHDRAVRAGILPDDVDAAGMDEIVRRFSRNARALAAFEPAPTDVPVWLFRACDGEPARHAADRWRGLLRDCRVLDVPGDHYTVMREPAVRRLAEQLQDVLEQL